MVSSCIHSKHGVGTLEICFILAIGVQYGEPKQAPSRGIDTPDGLQAGASFKLQETSEPKSEDARESQIFEFR